MSFGQSHWEWSRAWKPPMFEGNQNFIPKIILDFRSPFVYMTWSLYRISKDKILHKVRKAGLGTPGFRSRAVLHSPTCAGVHTPACVLHSCSHAHSVHLKPSSSHSYCPWVTPCAPMSQGRTVSLWSTSQPERTTPLGMYSFAFSHIEWSINFKVYDPLNL